MEEENIKLEENPGIPQEPTQEQPVSAAVSEVPAESSEDAVTGIPAAEETVPETPEVPVKELTDALPAPEIHAEEPEAAEKSEKEKKQKQSKEKKEKKPCGFIRFFAHSKNGGALFAKCLLLLLLALVCAYAGLMIWGLVDKFVPTFYYGAYCALATAGLFLFAGIVLVIVMIVRHTKNGNKGKR